MKSTPNNIPIYQEFIDTIEKGLRLLDENAQKEIQLFITSQQHESGAFTDRAGNPDYYYSLFGFWLASAFNMPLVLEKLKQFTAERQYEKPSKIVDRFAMLLIHKGLNEKQRIKPKLFWRLSRSSSPVNFSYQLFLILLAADAVHAQKWWFRFGARIVLRLYKISDEVPCSIVSAMLIGRAVTSMRTTQLQHKLLQFFDEKVGFKCFQEMPHSDLLSTGVSLFALTKSDYDLRLVAPVCYRLIEQNYANGAFLSGDGDLSQDLEYTFYGLLALGCLAREQRPA
ncbi:MAG TPA: hypothetical protein VKA27_08285 [Sunxiuqinia sp.]|nr:hypothetical protein [Sunxiuqinia sp.]